ncbi:hypothetical protein F5Y19DRAFT_475154 [Xylariaceae sp. FL1651]|nr:hypothetical protein F5Y19DRAFT_475154 [Xylariaceae sp. FL1651]
MHLLKLPSELVQLIFEYIFKSRQPERVMRIRIVSHTSSVWLTSFLRCPPPLSELQFTLLVGQFKTYIDHIIFRLRLLCRLFDTLPFQSTEILFQRKPAFAYYVRSYLAYQMLREKSTTSLLGRIHRAAKAVCEKEVNTGDYAVMTNPVSKSPKKSFDEDLKADLYVAAICLGKQSYVEELIAKGSEFCNTAIQPDVRSTVFGGAFHAATRQGNLNMIELLLSRIAEYRNTCFLPVSRQQELLRSASLCGHQDAFDFALDMRPISLPTESERTGCSDVMVLEKVIMNRKGNTTVVKLLLSQGVDIHECYPPPIVLAVFKERMDLFNLLREHDARLDTPETGGWAMALAKLHHLSSMVDVLVREGVGQDVVLHYVPTIGQRWWHRT